MRYLCAVFIVCFLGCTDNNTLKETNTLFTLVPSEHTQIKFKNKIVENNGFNFLNYSYIYNGGGVAVGDLNNDGLEDIYFTSNQQSNKLYLNTGDFVFKDITAAAKVVDNQGWTTGVSMIDINLDGFLDIYVCKSGEVRNPLARKNKLYINQKNNTFLEQAGKFGIADTGFSTQAYFFDYDKDGDLDLYIVNHRPDFGNLRATKTIVQEASDQLYRNDGARFTNVSIQAGIQNKSWGLSAAIGDFNEDSWPDIYVCNDFSEADNLYINDKNGGFTDEILTIMDHISLNSMGSDFADIDNDNKPDLVVLDMSSEDHIRSKTNMPSMSTKAFEKAIKEGKHYQYMFNTLQLNKGNTVFSEIAQLSNIAKTDWSWAPLLADFDNDGHKDLFVTNGILKDIGNVDFRNDLADKITRKQPMTLESLLNEWPTTKLNNYVFRNEGNYNFSMVSEDWGITTPTFSNGAAYADLDNDGDLDLIINNLEDEAFIYQNNTIKNHIKVQLLGPKNNPLGIGAKAKLSTNENIQTQELYVNRGFQSSVSRILNFGIDNAKQINALSVVWPDGKQQIVHNIDANTTLQFNYKEAERVPEKVEKNKAYLTAISRNSLGIDYKHTENEHNDYKNQLLLPYKLSQNGPFLAIADVNSDGLEDFFIGGAAGQEGALYVQNKTGQFTLSKQKAWNLDKDHEDVGVLFFDFDGDSDSDLYIVSGGNAFEAKHELYQDRLYENNGKGIFTRVKKVLPENNISGKIVIPSDIDKDGDLDLFVGGRHIPGKYPYAPQSSILINTNGVYTNATDSIASELSKIGMVTGAVFTDYDNDDDQDLLVVGEWMPITLFENNNGFFSLKKIPEFKHTTGLWSSIIKKDVNNDGYDDYFLGNIGLNTKYKADESHNFHIYCDDFDSSGSFDIVLSNTYKDELVPIRGKECSSRQVPLIAVKFKNYNDFAKASLEDIYGTKALEKALHYKADMLYSVHIQNNRGSGFTINKLPNEFQMSPITDFEVLDINKDGIDELLAVGNLYPVEIETTRFDASKGAVLDLKDSVFTAIPNSRSGFKTKGDTRAVKRIKTEEGMLILVTNNNDKIDVFRTNH